MAKKISRQKLNISSTIGLFTVLIVTLGVVIGSGLVSNPTLQQSSTEAAVPDELTLVENQDVTVTFTDLVPHNRWDYMLSGTICFAQRPPSGGRWRMAVYHDGLEDPSIPIGASVYKIASPPSSVHCAATASFNAPINLPGEEQLPEGEECLPAGNLNVRSDTLGWQVQREVGIIDRGFFCEGEPGEQNTPTPGPTGEPGDITANIQVEGTWKEGFDEFEVQVATCDYNEELDENGRPVINWGSCGTDGNKSSNIDVTRKSTSTIDKPIVLSIQDAEGGDKALVVFYSYKKTNDKADNTGIGVEVLNDQECSPTNIDFGAYGCGITINGDTITRDYHIYLPDPNLITYDLWLGRETGSSRELMSHCAHVVDTDEPPTDTGYARDQCTSRFEDGNLIVTYHNSDPESGDQKVYWQASRCNGSSDENLNVCEVNAPVETEDLVQNVFEPEEATDVTNGNVVICTFDVSEYPEEETEANVRSSGAISCETAEPTPTPEQTHTPTPSSSPTPSPTPTPEDEDGGQGQGYYNTISLFNGSSKVVTSVKIETCHSSGKCSSELVNTSIQSQQRGFVDSELKLPSGINAYTVGCAVTFEGSTNSVPCPNEVNTATKQNILYRMFASDGGLNGNGVTETEACDVNTDQCCNANDFAVVGTQYGDEAPPAELNLSDIDGNGIINGIDLAYTQANLGQGPGCRQNQDSNDPILDSGN